MQIILGSKWNNIENIYTLQKIGAGHDGHVYRYGDLALKLLKYDYKTRMQKGLMTFEKALYLQDNAHTKRIVMPTGILHDINGSYCGYAMEYINESGKSFSDFTCQEFLECIINLMDDAESLTKINTIIKDINRGSYLLSTDFLHMCDTDKYEVHPSSISKHSVRIRNQQMINFAICKYIYYEFLKIFSSQLDNKTTSRLIQLVKVMTNGSNTLQLLEKDLNPYGNQKVENYIIDKYKNLTRMIR